MLRNSFVLVRGIGSRRESALWRSGVTTWDEFLDEPKIQRMSEEGKLRMDAEILNADANYRRRDASFFAARLPSREHWRCYGDFNRAVVYLDIETTGISPRSPVTVVGIFDGTRMHSLIRGQNLTGQNLRAILSSASLLITYNGASFDLPMLELQFPGTVPKVPHVDLRHVLRRLGLSGGLKNIEREMGIMRDRRVEYMTGEDAVYLWRLWERQNSRNALDLLLEYNSEDCRNLKALATHAYCNLKRLTFDAAVKAWKD
jgi:uncharacterized protein YprB with RNaseH-like and TPR domain